MGAGLRDLIKIVSPTWLQTGVAEKLLYVFELSADALLEKLNQGMRAHMPGYGDASALPYVGLDRLIPQGLTESATAYATRLKYWLDDWRIAGSAHAVLQQVLGFVASLTPMVRTVTDSSAWDTYIAGSSPQTQAPSHVKASNWNWDNDQFDPLSTAFPTAWWRWWLILYSLAPNAFTGTEGTWGDGATWGDATASWGLSQPPAVWASLRSLVGLWKSGNSWCRWIIVSFDSTLFDPTQPADGTHNPAGTFGPWAATVNNQVVPTRFANARYVDGIASIGNGIGSFPTW